MVTRKEKELLREAIQFIWEEDRIGEGMRILMKLAGCDTSILDMLSILQPTTIQDLARRLDECSKNNQSG